MFIYRSIFYHILRPYIEIPLPDLFAGTVPKVPKVPNAKKNKTDIIMSTPKNHIPKEKLPSLKVRILYYPFCYKLFYSIT